MPTQVQFRRGNEGQNNNFKGAAGEISINTDTNSVRVHNGITTGGFELARDDLSNVGNASISGILTATQFVGDGSGLTNLVATGVGVEIRDNISVVGTAATIDFGDNLVVSLAAGVATVTALNTSKWGASPSGIVTTSNVGIGTTDPQYALHVIGDVRITGILTIGNSSVTIDGNTNTINIGSGVTVYGNTGIVSASALYVNGANISNSSGYASTAGIATYATSSGIATYASTAGVSTTLTATSSVNTTGIITASKFVGDGSGVTGVIGVSTQWITTSAGIHTLSKVGIGTTNPVSVLSIGGTTGIVFTQSDIKLSISPILTTVSGIVTDYTIFNLINSQANQNYTVNNRSGTLSGIGFTATLSRNSIGELNGLSLTNGGSGFVVGENIIIPGNLIGGTTPADDFRITVKGVSGGAANDLDFAFSIVPSAANQSYTVPNLSGNIAGTKFTFQLYRNSIGGSSGWNTILTATKDFSLYERITVPGNLVGGTSPTDDIKLSITGITTETREIYDASTGKNIFIGQRAGQSNTPQVPSGEEGRNNNFIGNNAGPSNTTGKFNNFFGDGAGYTNTSGDSNIFIGSRAGYYNTTSVRNFFVGRDAGFYNTTGGDNNFVGSGAGYCNTTGCYNNFLGRDAGFYNTIGNYNDFVGGSAGYYNTTGGDNNFIGNAAGYCNTTGSCNNFFGLWSGYYNTTGICNNAFGVQAGNCNLTGNKNNFFGNYTGVHTNTSYRVVMGEGFDSTTAFDGPKDADKQFAVGLNTTGTSEYWLVGDENFNIGIGTTNPTTKLQVGGTVTATAFVGDGSGLTGIVGTGSGVEVRDNGSVVGTASTIDFGDNLTVTFSAGIMTVTGPSPSGSGSDFVRTSAGIHTLGNVGVGTTNPKTALTVNGIISFSNTNVRIGGTDTGSKVTTSLNNVFIGVGAGNSISDAGGYSIFMGESAGGNATGGFDNIFMNDSAGFNNTTGSSNNFLGYYAGYCNTTGGCNNFFGLYAGRDNTTGSYNNFFGFRAGESNTTGNYNNLFGLCAGYYNTTGTNNNFFGFRAGQSNTTGTNNNFFGSYSGISTSASNKIILGSGAYNQPFDSLDTNKDTQLAIGIRTDANPANYWLVGDENFNIGIGTTNPTSKLQVGGTVTATAFVGDGSGLTNLPAGPAGTSDFIRTSAGIHTLGNVGVGTTNPTTALQIGSVFDPRVIGFGTVSGYAHPGTNVLIGDTQTGSSLTPQAGGPWKGLDNTFIGASAGAANTTGNGNIFIGLNAGCSNTEGSYNNFFGLYSGCSNTTGKHNNFLGSYGTGKCNTTGCYNNFFGNYAGKENTTGSYNFFGGYAAGKCNTTGIHNNFIGYKAGFSNTDGSYNNFIGYFVGLANTTGGFNNFYGYDSGCSNTSGGYNSFYGSGSGCFNTTGCYNNFFGYKSGRDNTTGCYNSFFGDYSGRTNTTGRSNLFLGSASGLSTGASYKVIMGSGNAAFRFDSPEPNKNVQFAVGVRSDSNSSRYWITGDENMNLVFYNSVIFNNDNIKIGYFAGGNANGGGNNVFIGYGAGYNNSGASDNNFIGNGAGYYNTTGQNNSFFGEDSGNSNTIGCCNSFFGRMSGCCNTTGSRNSFFGTRSGSDNRIGNYNVFLGAYSGISTASSNKVIIGVGTVISSTRYLFDSPDTTKNTQLAIGARTDANPSNYWLVGNENFNIGIGTTNPSEKLSVTGNIALNQTTVYGSVQASTASTSVTGIHSGLSTSVYRSVEYTIQATSGTNYQAIKILAIHDGTTAYDTQYGNIYNTEVATFDVDISAGNVRLVAAATSTSTTNYTVNFIATKI